MGDPADPKWFRQVLGQYPTGVCAVTAKHSDGSRAGFVVGSFTSVSLDPPLVAFFPDKNSTSWPKIERVGRFCVNILGEDQEHLCRRFASKAADKFEGLETRTASSGSPILDGVVAWIDCDLHSIQEAGDHYVVIARVRELEIESPALPLLFFQGGYGRFAPHSLAASNRQGVLTEQLRVVDLVRSEMEHLVTDLAARCIATTPVDDHLVVLASAAGAGAHGRAMPVGVQLPFAPPNGGVMVAWSAESVVSEWLKPLASDAARAEERERLAMVRRRGYSVGLLNDAQREFASALDRLAADPGSIATDDLRDLVARQDFDPSDLTPEAKSAIRLIAVPVFDHSGDVALALTLYGFPKPDAAGGIDIYIHRVREAANRATKSLGGHNPILT